MSSTAFAVGASRRVDGVHGLQTSLISKLVSCRSGGKLETFAAKLHQLLHMFGSSEKASQEDHVLRRLSNRAGRRTIFCRLDDQRMDCREDAQCCSAMCPMCACGETCGDR